MTGVAPSPQQWPRPHLSDLLKLLGSGGRNRDKYNTARFADINADGHDDLLLAVSGDDARKATSYPGMRHSRIILNDGSNHWIGRKRQ